MVPLKIVTYLALANTILVLTPLKKDHKHLFSGEKLEKEGLINRLRILWVLDNITLAKNNQGPNMDSAQVKGLLQLKKMFPGQDRNFQY